MRIATFNVLSGRSPGEDRVDEARFRQAIGSLDADVLGLQEVDRRQPRSAGIDLTAVAADAMGAGEQVFAPALIGVPGDPWLAATGEETPDAPAYGIAFLSRYAVTAARVVRLTGAPVPLPHRSPGHRRPVWVHDEPRVAIVAEVDAPGGPVDVVTTHLSFLRPWNRRQLRLLMAALGPLAGRRIVLVGDLNMQPRPAHRITGLTPLATGRTFPAHAPREQIDHILATGFAAARPGRAVELPVSDHRALLVDV